MTDVAVSVDLELQDSMRLDVLAVEINEAHHEAEQMAQGALERACAAGERLNEAKSLCQHGTWLGWLAENFSGSARKAQRYMRLADQWDELEAKNDTVSHLGVRQALELLSEPKEIEEAEVEPIEVKPSPEVLLRRIKAFKDDRIIRLFESHELTMENAVLLGHIKNRGMSNTLDALLEHDSEAAKVRNSKPSLEHLLKQNESRQTDEQTAELVERVENGETSSVFDVHRVRQEERREPPPAKDTFDELNDDDQALVNRMGQTYLGGYGGESSREAISKEVQKFAERRDDWADLEPQQKQTLIEESFGKRQGKRYDKTPVTRQTGPVLTDADVQTLQVACSNLIALAMSTKALSSGDKATGRESLERVQDVAGRLFA